MTLDKTIKEAKVTAILFEKEACKCIQHGGSFYEEQAKAFRESAREFGQIAEWLTELKAYREVYKTTDRQPTWIPCDERLPEKSELVDRLRIESKCMGKYGVDYIATLLMQAADTIEMLSEKARIKEWEYK